MSASNIITMILVSAGLVFMLISLIGIIRLPDFYTRLHAQGIGDTLGALLIILGMMAASGFRVMSIKLFLVFVFIAVTNPLGTNMMMIAGMNNREYREYKKKKPEGTDAAPAGPAEEGNKEN